MSAWFLFAFGVLLIVYGLLLRRREAKRAKLVRAAAICFRLGHRAEERGDLAVAEGHMGQARSFLKQMEEHVDSERWYAPWR